MIISFLRKLAGGILFLAILAVLVWMLLIGPEWLVSRAGVHSAIGFTEATATATEIANLQNEMRKTILQVEGGLFAILALYLTYRRVKVAEQRHITDRFTRAIEQLGVKTVKGKPNVEVRLGAIYALERIAKDSPRDHWTIMEVFTAYVRQNAPAPTQPPTDEENETAIAKGPAMEIQAILTVLGRRRRGHGREQKGKLLDLRDSDLRGAYFGKAHFEKAHFGRSHIEGAIFQRAYVKKARFYKANLEGAYFVGAHVAGADFHEAHVAKARFYWTVGLAVDQFKNAEGWEEAQFDEDFLRKLKTAKGMDSSSNKIISQPKTQSSKSLPGEDGAGTPDHPITNN
jgi:Pentapeptide repeats (8 copies)